MKSFGSESSGTSMAFGLGKVVFDDLGGRKLL